MGLMDEVKSAKPTTLGASGTHFIDADTLANPNGPNYRLQGLDSAEVAKVVFPDGEDPKLKQGTAGGYETTGIVSDLANKTGFTNVKPLFNPDGTPQFDTGSRRQLADITNDKGESFNQSLLNAGAFDPTSFTSTESLASIEIAEARRNAARTDGSYVDNEFDQAATLIEQAERGEGAKALGFKETLINEQKRGQMISAFEQKGYSRGEAIKETNKYFTYNTHIDNAGRDQNNDSTNPISDSWDQGWIGAQEGAYGFLELLGETTGVESLEKIGTDGIRRKQDQSAEFARVLTDWQEVDWENPSTGVQFLVNNAAMSLPYMVTTGAAAIAGAAVTAATGGGALAVLGGSAVALGSPASIYSGQVWNEMEGEKNAGIALGAGLVQASLDRLGLGAITGKLIPGNLKAQAIKKIVEKTGVTEAAAKLTLANATKAELGGFLKDSAAIGVKQLADKKLGKELLKGIAIGGAGEAVTEAGQEAIGYLAATQGSDKDFVWAELNDRLIAAAIAGGSLGGAFAAPGGIKGALGDLDASVRRGDATAEYESQAGVWAAEETAAKGYVPTNSENLGVVRASIDADGLGSTLSERAAASDVTYGQKTLSGKLQQAVLNPLGALQGSVSNVLTADIQGRSRSARVLQGILGGGLQKVYGGSSFENAKHHRNAIYKNMIPIPDQLLATLSKGKRLTEAKKIEISNGLYGQLNAAVDAAGNFDPALLPQSDNKQTLIAFGNQLNALSNKMYKDQQQYNNDLGFEKNYLFKYKAVDKKNIHNDRAGFASLLQSEYNMTPAKAKELADIMAEDPNASDLASAFSVADGGSNPGAHKARTLALSENSKFDHYMQKNIFANIDQASKSASRYATGQEFLGKDNANISKLLDQMQAEGLSEAEVDKVAAGVRDFLEAESGNYKRPTSAVGKKLQKFQKYAMTGMTLAGLPLATISSFVEAALVSKSLTNDQIFGEGKTSLKSFGKEGWSSLSAAMGDTANYALRRETLQNRTETDGQKQIRELGYKEWDVGAGTVSGVTEINAWQQDTYKNFFNYIGLSQWTDYTRAVRASMGGDYIISKIEVLAAFDQTKERTREVQEAQEAIRNLGINAELFVAQRNAALSGVPLQPEQKAEYEAQLREGMFNWVNDAVALPQAANRPLIYQDPRFALFTQFQGFISAFTANHIPKMWGEMVKRGTPAMKYSAFATMLTMIMLGFMSQALKDELKYDDEEEKKTLGNPHLETADYIRRGIFASGLLGTAERAISAFDPVYESRKDGLGDYVFDPAIGESPALSYLQRIAGGIGSLAEGDVGGFTKAAVKSAPLAGPFSSVADYWGDKASGWNFNGES